MRPHVLLASLLAGAFGLCSLAAGERPRPVGSAAPKAASRAREERAQQVPADFLGRCRKMLAMQIEVSKGTEALHKAVQGIPRKHLRPKEKQASLKLSIEQKAILREATTAIALITADGSAVAFDEVFQELRVDMKRIQRRLEINDVGLATQALEKDVIDTLKEMVAALQKC